MKGTTESQGFTDYLSVYNGRFVKRVKEPTAETTTRETKSGKTVHELSYDFVIGVITNVEKRDSDYGFNLHLLLVDADEKNDVTIKFYDSATRIILNKLSNVDFTKPVKLMVGKNDEGRTWFTIKQAGRGFEKDIVPNAYTREDIPDAKKIKVQGKEVWNFDEQADFLWEKFQAKAPAPAPAAPAKKELDLEPWDAPTMPTDGTDDLPF